MKAFHTITHFRFRSFMSLKINFQLCNLPLKIDSLNSNFGLFSGKNKAFTSPRTHLSSEIVYVNDFVIFFFLPCHLIRHEGDVFNGYI